MFKKKEKLRVGRPKLADSNLKKMSLLISAICFVMVIGLIFGGLLDLNIIGNTHKLKAEANTSTLCTSIPDSLKYDENTNPYGFKDAEFFSGVLEHGHVSGDAREVYRYNDSSYCTSITKEDLEKIDRVSYSNNTISNANGIQLLTNLEELYLYCSGGLYNDKITSIDLSHNAKLVKLSLDGLTGIKNFDFSNNPNLSTIEIGRPIYYGSFVIDNLTIKNNNNLKTITNAANFYDNTISVSAGTIKNLDIENVPNLKKDKSMDDLKVTENIKLSNTDQSLIALTLGDNQNVDPRTVLDLKSIYLENLIYNDYSRDYKKLSMDKAKSLESLYIDNVKLIRLDIGYASKLKNAHINIDKDSLLELNIGYSNISDNDIDISSYKNLESLEFISDNSSVLNNIDLLNYPNLTSLALGNLNSNFSNNGNIKLNNLNLKVVPNLEYLSLGGVDIDNLDLSVLPNLSNVDLIKANVNNVSLPNNDLSCFDIYDSNVKNLNLKNAEWVEIFNSSIGSLDLKNNSTLFELALVNTDVKKLDLSNNENLRFLDVYNNSLNTIYMNKNSKENISDYLKINDKYGITYELENSDVIKIDKDVITPLKTGDVTIKVNHNDSLRSYNKEELLEIIKNKEYGKEMNSDAKNPLSEINVHVYDVTSSKYNIDDKTKVIDLKKNNIDLNEIKLGIDSLVKEISGNKLYLKDTSGNIVDEYTLVNKKEDEKESIKEEVKTTTKKKTTSKKSSTKKTTTTKKASETTTTTIKSDNDKENTKVVTNEKVVEKIAYKSNNLTLIIINIVEGILLLTLAILFIKSMKKNKN